MEGIDLAQLPQMMLSDRLLARRIQRSIWLNDVLIPVEGADYALGRYVDHLVELTDDEVFRLSLASSTTLVEYNGRYLALCTRHQLKGRKLEEIGLIIKNGQNVITSGGQTHFPEGNISDALDLAAFDFTAPCMAGVIEKRRFFPLREAPPICPADAIAFVICAGFPYDAQRYELDESHIGSTKMLAVCEPESDSHDPALLKLKPVEPLPVKPDGMSGGSAFACIIVGNEASAFFAGIITRASQQAVHIVKAGFVLEFLDMIERVKTGKNGNAL
ncbi:hypothetical protein FE840_001420 [Peteryoungia desertarenae]|uniref:Uncharacterized protein n=1 Tax=Peteryoungia desertarenae TaxID=1813451 RepID=A0ABX6QIJ1_9HYPH|nr:hypothetical protein [Peteryoungia desertarenae]QLF68319.1 hypothetical protein FE840_001420 [Peteryoungia desertarenae]